MVRIICWRCGTIFDLNIHQYRDGTSVYYVMVSCIECGRMIGKPVVLMDGSRSLEFDDRHYNKDGSLINKKIPEEELPDYEYLNRTNI